MESGSIAAWNVKVGDSFEPGTAICEVATDKATVTFEATDDGYVAQILVPTTDSGEVKVGDPLLVTVGDASSVAAFANFTLKDATGGAAPATPVAAAPTPVAMQSPPAAVATPTVSNTSNQARVYASPYAKKLIRDGSLSVNLSDVTGTGFNGRITSDDVLAYVKAQPAPAVSSAASTASAPAPQPAVQSQPVSTSNSYSDFTVDNTAGLIASQYTMSKQTIPHYYLSIELDLTQLLATREALNNDTKSDISVLDFMIRAAALSMNSVPDVNASWMDTFVRRHNEVNMNIVMSSDNAVVSNSDHGLVYPMIANTEKLGLDGISKQMKNLEAVYHEGQTAEAGSVTRSGVGTFTIHNTGQYGIKSVAPIIHPSQACALGIGSIIDTVVPNKDATGDEDNWRVAPVVMVTLSCDHRVIDGAVGATYLQSFKNLIENPMRMLL